MPALASCVHFIGFKDDRYWNAVRIWGRPHFVHMRLDLRARREFAPNDLIIFAEGDEAQPPCPYNAPDIIEADS